MTGLCFFADNSLLFWATPGWPLVTGERLSLKGAARLGIEREVVIVGLNVHSYCCRSKSIWFGSLSIRLCLFRY
jgi:hypothetical protein